MTVLKGIRVIDLSTYALGPGACAILGDLGADVIKIELPGVGDPHRNFNTLAGARILKIQYPWEVDNRNKRSLAIDLKKEHGREVLYKLLYRSDVFVTNVRREALVKLKVDYASISSVKPTIIYAHASGYGERGSHSDQPGFDVTAFWASSGIMASLGEPEAPPPMSPAGFGDHAGSLALAAGILAALLHRDRTGEGQEVDVSLLGTALWCIGIAAAQAASGETKVTKMPSRRDMRNPLANTYLCQDGKWLMLTCLQSDRYWPKFCSMLGRPDLEHNERFHDLQQRAANCGALIEIIDREFAARPLAEWARLLDENGLIWAPVKTVIDAVNDTQTVENEFLSEVNHPVHGRFRNVMNPIKMSKTPPDIRQAAPELGMHTEEILLELGYTWDDILVFKEEGVI